MNRFISNLWADGALLMDRVFPSPLEVDRFISKLLRKIMYFTYLFPSPFEVNRFISDNTEIEDFKVRRFPSPFEVNRFLSQ